jgi:hypothetical protein
MLFKEIIACTENRTKPINAKCSVTDCSLCVVRSLHNDAFSVTQTDYVASSEVVISECLIGKDM